MPSYHRRWPFISAVLATGGGSQTTSVMRFLGATTLVHVGDTVEWTNLATPPFHTINFGTEPANLMPPSPGLTIDSDGVRHGVINRRDLELFQFTDDPASALSLLQRGLSDEEADKSEAPAFAHSRTADC